MVEISAYMGSQQLRQSIGREWLSVLNDSTAPFDAKSFQAALGRIKREISGPIFNSATVSLSSHDSTLAKRTLHLARIFPPKSIADDMEAMVRSEHGEDAQLHYYFDVVSADGYDYIITHNFIVTHDQTVKSQEPVIQYKGEIGVLRINASSVNHFQARHLSFPVQAVIIGNLTIGVSPDALEMLTAPELSALKPIFDIANRNMDSPHTSHSTQRPPIGFMNDIVLMMALGERHYGLTELASPPLSR